MKYLFLLLFFVSLSCSNRSTETEEPVGYIERQLSFFNPQEPMWQNGQYKGFIYEQWIREPENLLMIHETFKKLGYKNIFDSESRYSTVFWYGIMIKKPMNELLDSLILTRELDSISSKYYREFWNRRKSENNEEMVAKILNEVKTELYGDKSLGFDEQLVNDTLFNLFQMRDISDSITPELGMKHFNYLTNIGMHESAYNVLFESMAYEHLNWNRTELLKRLTIDSVNCCPWPWIEDDTK